MKKWAIYIFLITALFNNSCKQPTTNNGQYHQMLTLVDKEISTMLDTVKQHYSVTELVTSGFHELGFKLMTDSMRIDSSDTKKLHYGILCIEYGDYEKGLDMISSIKSPDLLFDKAYYKLTAALNSMDVAVSKPLLDSLYECLKNDFSKEREAAYLCMKGYHLHNCRKIQSAISNYSCALDTIKKYKPHSIELLRVYRRMANSYNDLYSKSVELGNPDTSFFNKAHYYYTNEKENIVKLMGNRAFRLISNELTTALLDSKHASELLTDVINRLYVTEDSEYLVTINPIYFTAALEFFACLPDSNKDSRYLISLTRKEFQRLKLINQQVISAMSTLRGNDIPIYVHQQSSIRNLIYHSYLGINKVATKETELLHWSSLSKNNSIDILGIARNVYGIDAEKATNSWCLLHEIKLLKALKHNEYLEDKSMKTLLELESSFHPLLESLNKKAINQEQLKSLVAYCKENDAIIIDYSLVKTILQIIKIDSSGIHSSHKVYSDFVFNKLFGFIPDNLSKLMEEDNVTEFERLGVELSKELGLLSCTQRNLIISAEQKLELVSFSALAQNNKNSKRWQDINYLGNTKNIRYVPNIYTLIKNTMPVHSKGINVLYSTKDNAQLPDNIDLIKFLRTKHNAKFNDPALNQNGILHLISHTKPDVHAVKFLFDKDTISLNTNGLRTDMAILHGCRSSSGKLVFSGYLSLNRTFLFNGTKAVISSYWDADNASSVFYFKEFYKHLMAGKSTSESMYSAEQAVKNNPKYVEWSKPFYWAGWRLMGQDLVFSQP